MASLATVPGLAESALAAEDLAALPPLSAPAPWSCRARALMWVQRSRAPEFDWAGRPLPFSLVVLVDYLDTPVGRYQEVLAGAVIRRGPWFYAQVPFIAVDSLASVHGGRANWGLPKTMAAFTGSAGEAAVSAVGEGWAVGVCARSSVPSRRVPLLSAFSCAGPLGRYRTTLRAKAAPVQVTTEITGPALTPWLGSGRRRAFVAEGRMTITAPVPL